MNEFSKKKKRRFRLISGLYRALFGQQSGLHSLPPPFVQVICLTGDSLGLFLHTDPVKVTGVAVLSLCGQVLADARRLPNSQKGYRHKKRCYIVRLQQPFVHLRQVVQECEQRRQQSHFKQSFNKMNRNLTLKKRDSSANIKCCVAGRATGNTIS